MTIHSLLPAFCLVFPEFEKEKKEQTRYMIILSIIIISFLFQLKIMSHVHTITNNNPQTIGPVYLAIFHFLQNHNMETGKMFEYSFLLIKEYSE